MNDLVSGHVDFFCEQVVSVAEQIAAGTIKAYGVSASERLASLPNVPTAKEAGVNYQMSIWAGIFAPKGTPKQVVDKLAAALNKALDDPSVQEATGRARRIASLQGPATLRDLRSLGEGGELRAAPLFSRPRPETRIENCARPHL